jgi:hypothetical protein
VGGVPSRLLLHFQVVVDPAAEFDEVVEGFVLAADGVTLHSRGQLTTEGIQQRVFISAEWGGETIELSYKGVKVGIALLEAFELALVLVFLIWYAVNPL